VLDKVGALEPSYARWPRTRIRWRQWPRDLAGLWTCGGDAGEGDAAYLDGRNGEEARGWGLGSNRGDTDCGRIVRRSGVCVVMLVLGRIARLAARLPA
jgi:hypothetical protein